MNPYENRWPSGSWPARKLAGLKAWILSWPVFQELLSFCLDAARHYKLDRAAGLARDAGAELCQDYRSSSSRLKRWLIFAVVLAAGMLAFAVAYHAYYNPNVARIVSLPMPAEAVRAKVVDLVDVAGGGGEIQPSATVSITSRFIGQVTRVPVNLGDIVTTDTVLYECDPRPFQAALVSAQEKVRSGENAAQIAERQDLGMQELKKNNLASEQDMLDSASVLATARSTLATAQQALINAEMDLAATAVKSPVNGIVLARTVNPGERIIPSQPTMKVGDLQDVYFVADINEDKVALVQSGLKAEVSFASFPGHGFTGDVVFVDPKVDPKTRTFMAYIKIPNSGFKLKPGVSGFARITQQKRALAVPDAAVVSPVGEKAYVFVITAAKQALLRPVRIGIVAQGWTEIGEGLSEGEMVATVGPLYLKDGDKVHYRLEGE